MSIYGSKVSNSGQNVVTIDVTKNQFNSEYTSPKIRVTTLNVAYKSVSIGALSSATIDIAHGLLYQPSFLLWFKDENGNWHFTNSIRFALQTPGNLLVQTVKTDKTNLEIVALNNNLTDSKIFDYHYVIFEDPI